MKIIPNKVLTNETEPYISLPSLTYSTLYADDSLVHEAAHLHHYLLEKNGSSFSKEWADKFLFPRNIIPLPWRSGILYYFTPVLMPYANYYEPIDERLDSLFFNEEYPYIGGGYVLKIGSMEIIVYNINDLKDVEEKFIKNIDLMPIGLKKALNKRRIYITPFIQYPSFFHTKNFQSELYPKIAEDVAVHTQYLYLMSKLPRELWLNNEFNINFKYLYNRFLKIPMLREKLDILIRYGFLDPNTKSEIEQKQNN